MHPLAGKHAYVTGASRGIGKAVATELARLGARLTLAARDEDLLRQNAESLAAEHGVVAEVVKIDLQDTGSLTLPDAVDILVNNAGIAPSAPFEKHSLPDWQDTFSTNVTATFRLSQLALPHMREQGWGRIVNVASTAGPVSYTHLTLPTTSRV